MIEGKGNRQEHSLEAAAAIRFGPLHEAERRLLLALPKGERAFAGPEGADLTAPENDPEHADQWGEEREVRVALLQWLCIDPNARAFVSSEGVRLAGARFDDRLVLSFVTVPFPLRLAACYFPKGIAIEGASLPSLGLVRCWIGQTPSADAAEPAVMASNLRLAGFLTLDHTHTVGESRLFGAEIGKTFNCEGASLRNAGGRSLNCEHAKIGGAALLRYGFTSEGEVRFFGATIGGNLECDRASFSNKDAVALNAEGAKIGSAVYLRSGFSAQGELRFRGTQIGGNLDCDGASVKNAGGVTLRCTGSKISGSAFLRSNFSSEGEVDLVRSDISGNLECDSGSFKNPPGRALNCELAKIGGPALLRHEFMSEGEVRFFNATFGGLDCTRGSFTNAAGPALDCEAAKIGSAVYLRSGFSAQGELRFRGAQIGGNLDCDGASVKNAGGVTLRCTGSKISGSAFLRSNFSSEGEVDLVRSGISGNLECDSGSFKNPSGRALNCELANVGGAALLRSDFTAEGEVRFFGATIASNLNCDRASFRKAAGWALNCEATKIGGVLLLRNSSSAEGEVRLLGTQAGHLDVEDVDLSTGVGGSLIARLAEIKGEFRIRALTCGPKTIVDLRGASCDLFADDPSARPEQGNLRLDGFVYRRLTNPGTAKARLKWVRCPLPADEAARRGTFRPQPYRLLAQTLRAQGDENDARWFLIRMAEDRRKYAQLGPAARFWTWLLWHIMRNGYRPMQVIPWLLVLWIVNAVLFGTGYELGLMGPTDEKAYTSFVADDGTPPPWYPSFRAPVYAIDTSLPIISLGVREKWQPLVKPAVKSWPSWLAFLEPGVVGVALAIWRWIAIVLGWFLASMLVAGVAALVMRE